MRGALLLLLFVASLAESATLTVSPGQSIAQAAQQLRPGDTLLVPAGTYPEAIGPTIPSGVTLRAQTPGTVVLQPGGNGPLYHGVGILSFDNGQHDITVDGLVIDGTGTYNAYLAYVSAATNITIQNSTLRNGNGDPCTMSGGVGLYISHDSSGTVLRNSTIQDIAKMQNGCTHDTAYGIYLVGSNATIEGNTIARVGGHGIHGYNAYPDGQPSSGDIVRNNTISDTGTRGILLSGHKDGVICGNTLTRTGLDGSASIQVGGYGNATSNVTVAGNVVSAPGGRALEIAPGAGQEVSASAAQALCAAAPPGGPPPGKPPRPAPRNLRVVTVP